MTDEPTEIDPVADILAAWQERRDRGEPVTLDDLVREHPALESVLRERVAALGALVKELTTGTAGAPRERLAPVRLDRYVRFRPAGEGGMGIVYWAIDSDLNREVAFKVIRPDVGGAKREGAAPTEPLHLTPPGRGTPASSAFETLKRRFLQEAWVTAGLEHPGIVPVYELGQTPEGVPYYTMRFVRGNRTLAGAIAAVRGRPLDERLALLEPFLKVCDTIRYAHAKGVIHRDLKPENVALGEFGEAVVLDWGLAKLSGAEDRTGEAWQEKVREMREASDLRTLASALGTPGYMSPEAALGRMDEVDGRSDVYSLGAILYEILVGRLPFTFESYGDLVRQLMAGSPPDPASVDPSVPAELSRVCLQALAKNREARQASVGVLASDLRAWLTRREADREAEALLREARAAIDGARDLAATDRLRALDRAGAALSRLRAVRPDDAASAAIATEVEDLRRRGVEEREAAARRRTARRAGAAALAAAAVVAAVVAGVVEGKRRETEQARAATAEALAAEKTARDAAEAATRRTRAVALAQASSQHVVQSPMLALLLARESLSLAETREAHDALRAALSASRERLHLAVPGGMRSAAAARGPGGFAIGTFDGAVHTWRADGTPGTTFPARGVAATALDLSPDGRIVAVGFADGNAEIRAADGGPATVLARGDLRVSSMAFDPTASRVVVLHGDWRSGPRLARRARLVARDGRDLASCGAAESPAVAAGFSADGSRALAACRDGTIVLWDADGREAARFAVAGGPVQTARLSPAGDRVAVMFEDASIRIVGTDGSVVASVPSPGPNAGVDVRFTPDGSRIVVNDWTAVRIWNADGTRVGEVQPPPDGRSVSNVVRALAVSPDGARIATATDDRVVRVYTSGGAEIAALRGHASMVTALWFSPDGQSLRSFARDEGLKVWDLSGGEAAAFAGHGGSVTQARFSADGSRVVTASTDGTARVWRPDGACEATLRSGTIPVRAAAFLPDGRVVTGATDGSARVWSADGAQSTVLAGHEKSVYDLAVSPDGSRIATASADGTARLWTPDGRLVATLAGASRAVARVAFSPDARLVATGSHDYSTRVWDASTGALRTTLEGGHTGLVAFSPDGRHLVTSYRVQEAQVWTSDGAPVATLAGHSLWVVSAAFSPDGSRVVTASLDGTARVWDLRGRCLAVLADHHGGVTSAAYSPDGALLVTTSDDRTARLWNADGGLRAVLPGHGSRVVRAEFSPDGRHVLTASDDGTARLFCTRESDLQELAARRAVRGFTRAEFETVGAVLGPDAERQVAASRLADARLAEEILVSDAVAAVERDTGLAPEMRRDVIEALRERRDDARTLNEAAWRVVGRPGGGADDVRRARRWAERAVQLEPDVASYVHTFGVARYSAGDAAGAVETLERSRALLGRGGPPDADVEAFLAMALAALGRSDEAAAALRRAEEASAAPDVSHATRASVLEAREVVGPGAPR